jgi:methionyl-tRNA synthetase
LKKQIDKLMATKKANDAEGAITTPGKDAITFDDFTKIDIRTATILEAEKVPKTTRLLKLKIDTGLDIRTIVSGIAEYYEPEAIIGKQISIVANLEARKIKGLESKGMILMAEDKDGKLVMVTPAGKVSNGSMIK